MREDARGVGKPLDAPKDPSADLGNFLPLFGTSQYIKELQSFRDHLMNKQ